MGIERLPAWVRWIAVIPVAIIGGYLTKLFFHLNPIPLGTNILGEFAAEMLGSAAVVVVGAYIALSIISNWLGFYLAQLSFWAYSH